MFERLWWAIGAAILLLGCGATTGEESEDGAATTVSLQRLHEAASPALAPAVRARIVRAGMRLRELQADYWGDWHDSSDVDPDDGGWDWVVATSSKAHSSSASSDNLYGAVGLGLFAALQVRGVRPFFWAALVDTYRGMRQNSQVDSAPDIVLLAFLSERFADPRYVKLARERYDARVIAAGGADVLAASIRDMRHAAATDGLIAYDLGWYALATLALSQAYPHSGYQSDVALYVRTVIDDLNAGTPAFDYRDTHEAYYVTGLAWSMLLSSWVPRQHALSHELRSCLLNQQLASGAWPYSAEYPEPNPQSTAHALIALGLSRVGDAEHNASERATQWLALRQGSNGGWAYDAEQEYPSIDAEIAFGMYLTRPALAETALRDGVKTAISTSAFSARSVQRRLPPPATPGRALSESVY